MGTEMNSNYYDEKYLLKPKYNCHYSESPYIELWKRSIELMPIDNGSIMELGCGVGQFAHMLYDSGFDEYEGIDFSRRAISMAQELNPQFNFRCRDIKNKDFYRKMDLYICMETLEHIFEDLTVLMNIPKGCNILITVPDFWDPAHVRHFKTEDEVVDRYGMYMSEVRCERLDRWFIMTGKRK